MWNLRIVENFRNWEISTLSSKEMIDTSYFEKCSFEEILTFSWILEIASFSQISSN
jgi:hypothetical protein